MDNKELDENLQEPKREVISEEKAQALNISKSTDEPSSPPQSSSRSSGVSWGFCLI